MVEPTDQYYRDLAQEIRHNDGGIAFDENAAVNRSEDGGAYVQAWVRVADPEGDDE